MYCEAKGDICKVLKYSLQESSGAVPIVILVIFLKLTYIDILCGISPKNSPYVNIEWK
jgi:hypothetical protein